MATPREPRFRPARWVALWFLVTSVASNGGVPLPPPPSAPPPPPAPVADKPPAADDDPGSTFDNLDVVDDVLKGKLAVMRVGSEPSPNNLLSVFAGLRNRTKKQLNLEVQTIYRDKMGNDLNAGSWIFFSLKPREEKEYRSTSITDQAVDFLIRVRRAKAAPKRT
jgi:hypothetical protein